MKSKAEFMEDFMKEWIDFSNVNARFNIKGVFTQNETRKALIILDQLMTSALIPLSNILFVKESEDSEEIKEGRILYLRCRDREKAKQLFHLVAIANGKACLGADNPRYETSLWIGF